MEILNRNKELIKQRLLNGESYKSIAKDYGVHISSIRRFKNKLKLKIDAGFSSRIVKGNSFAVLSQETYYWLGFMMGDGYITRHGKGNPNFLIGIDLQIGDKEHLEKFNKYVGSEVPVKVYPEFSKARVCFTNPQVQKTLVEYGVTSRKTYDCKLSIDMTPDFIRGLLDADGGVSIRSTGQLKQLVVVTTASKDLANQVSSYLESNGIETITKVYTYSGFKDDRVRVAYYDVRVPSFLAKKEFFKFCIKGSSIFLDRKREKFRVAFE